MSTHRLPKAVRRNIEEALKSATLVNASFTQPGGGLLDSAPEYTDEVREATRLYRETWIIGPLQDVLDWDDGKTDTSRLMWADR